MECAASGLEVFWRAGARPPSGRARGEFGDTADPRRVSMALDICDVCKALTGAIYTGSEPTQSHLPAQRQTGCIDKPVEASPHIIRGVTRSANANLMLTLPSPSAVFAVSCICAPMYSVVYSAMVLQSIRMIPEAPSGLIVRRDRTRRESF